MEALHEPASWLDMTILSAALVLSSASISVTSAVPQAPCNPPDAKFASQALT